MTWLKIIFPFYLLILTCMPCADNCYDEVQPTQTTISTTDTHSHNDTEKESCSPFCICSCCSIPVSISSPILFPSAIIIAQSINKFSNYTFSFQSVQFNIWQPPKLS